VIHLRAALTGLGHEAGDAESKDYDASLAAAVKALYDQAGYAPPGSEDQTLVKAVRDARDGVTDAKDLRAQAAAELTRAQSDAAKAVAAEDKELARQAVEAARTALASAERGVQRAQEGLSDAERAAWTPMPVGEVVFVADLPRRVDQVGVKVGTDLAKMDGGASPESVEGAATPAGAAVVLSGAEITVTAQVPADEAALLTEDGPAVLTVEGKEITGKIAELCPEPTGGAAGGTDTPEPSGATAEAGAAAGAPPTGQCAVTIAVADLGGMDPAAMVGNVLATMVVGTTSEDSLVVPLAAVSADTAGNARIEVVEGGLVKDQPAAEQRTRVVKIVAGLAAEGMVEVKEADYDLKAGDLVVIGQGAAGGGADGAGAGEQD
jgi:hypothetical protein